MDPRSGNLAQFIADFGRFRPLGLTHGGLTNTLRVIFTFINKLSWWFA